MTVFNTLYKKSSTGAMLQWDLSVVQAFDEVPGAYKIVTEHGQVGGKIQSTDDLITEGKNIGKVNETDRLTQALKEAKAKWTKQRDTKGYVESIEEAEAGKTSVVVGAMLAHGYWKHSKKMKFPCLTQPKLDGVRCEAKVVDGKCNLYSRTGKPILCVPTLATLIEEQLVPTLGQNFVVDGELYNHDLKDDFEKIISLVRKQKPMSLENQKLVEYHVYDLQSPKPFPERIKELEEAVNDMFEQKTVVFVEATEAESEEEAFALYEEHLIEGYEGIMFRSKTGGYETKRSYNLQKYKGELHEEITSYEEEEFKVVGVKEGRGKERGHAAAFWCVTENGDKFKARIEGKIGYKKQCFDDHSLWEGKVLTVKFQGWTNKNNVPRCPIGKAIRDYE